MRAGETRLRRARSLIVYWQNRRLFLLNFARRTTVSARPFTCEILHFFSTWRKPQSAVAHFRAYTPESVAAAVNKLAAKQLLLAEHSEAALQDKRINREWRKWLPEGSFHFGTKNAVYVRGRTRAKWLKVILPKTPPPPQFKTIPHSSKVKLSRPTLSKSEFVHVLMSRQTHRAFSQEPLPLIAVSQLLYLVWGVTGSLNSPVFGKLPHKTSPSGGARHPGEVYLMALKVQGLKPGLYHYHAARHQLELVRRKISPTQAWKYCAHQDYVRNAAALFLMTAVFPRTMWKYAHARAYRVVLLDAGHLCQTFCLVATWLGLAPFCTAALNDTLIEQDLGIDGIRESVLYVAGAGAPVTSKHPGRQIDHDIQSF